MDRASRILLAAAATYLAVLVACYFLGAYDVKRHHIEAAGFIFAAVVFARFLLAPPVGPDRAKTKQFLFVYLLIAALGLAAYWRVLGVGLLSDDHVLRAWVLDGRFSWADGQFVRPVPLVLWRVVFALGGSATALHALNLALHLANAILGFRIAALLGLTTPGAAVASLVFLLSPLQVEPVAWAAGVFDLMVGTLMLSTVVIFLSEQTARSRTRDILMVCGLTTLAVLTKESAVALPLLILLLVIPARQTLITRRHLILWIPVLVLTLTYVGWRVAAHHPIVGTASVSRYMVKEQLSRTFGALIVPFSEISVRDSSLTVLWVVLGTTILIAGSFIRTNAGSTCHAVALKGVLWCILAPLPTLGLLFVGPYLDGSRYLYLATLGWGISLGALLDTVADRLYARRVAVGFALSLVIAGGIEQQRRIADWQGAAFERERILAEANRMWQTRQCGSVSAANLPPRFRGAQLFNNGFAEALGLRQTGTASSECRWTWNGRSFHEN